MESQRSSGLSGWIFDGHPPAAGQHGAPVDSERLLTEDRERIGHDLHDLVIRDLFAVSLKLHGALPLIENDRAEQRVGDALGDLDQAITNVRLAVFELLHGSSTVRRPGLRARLVELVDEFGRDLGHHPTLALDGPIDAIADRATADDVIRSLRDALLGLVCDRGAQGGHIGLAARAEPWPHLLVRVCGDRFGPEHPGDGDALRPWLEDLRARLGASQGDFAVDERPHAITLTWTVSGG